MTAATMRLHELVCARCGDRFLAERRQRLCPRHKGGRNRGWATPRSCRVCGASFWPRSPHASRCAAHRGTDLPWQERLAAGRRPRIRGQATCVSCRQPFDVRTHGQAACSRSCARKARAAA